MHQAMLFESLGDSRVQCNICRWRCKIAPGKAGVCHMYTNEGGVLYSRNYARPSTIAIDPVEKKPLFHFYPASQVFSIGGWGCNFHCADCQNWEISCVNLPEEERMLSPEEAVKMTKKHNSRGIAWTYNEPTMWFEYTLDTARLAKRDGLYTVYVTNGYITPEALDAIGPYLDAWRVDVKGFNDDFYKNLAKISHWQGILETAKRAKNEWGMHIEVVTNIIPTMNDDDTQLSGIAGWIRAELGELTPWHVTRFYPNYNLSNLPATPVATLERAVEIGKKAGLRFIYTGNVPGHECENTVCYACGKTVVKRLGYQTEVLGLSGSACAFCGAELNFRTDMEC